MSQPIVYLTPVTVNRVEITEPNKEGDVFRQVVLSQDMLVPTNNGGDKFMTRELFIFTEWDEARCLKEVGKTMVGNIIRKEVAAYQWFDADGVEHESSHRYVLGR